MISVDGDHGAQRAAGEQFPDRHDVGQESGPHRLHREETTRASLVDDAARLGGVHREGLLDEDVLTVRQSEQRVLLMHRVRRCDVHGLDRRIGDQSLVRVVPTRDVERVREKIHRLLRARADGDDHPLVRQRQIAREGLCDATGPDHTPSNWFCHFFSLKARTGLLEFDGTHHRHVDDRRTPAPNAPTTIAPRVAPSVPTRDRDP